MSLKKVSGNSHYDAIVVGSGISGGWAAKELTEKGLNTLLLERGPYVEHVKDYTNEHKPLWDKPLRGKLTLKTRQEYPVNARSGLMSEFSKPFFFKDSLSSYVEEEPFTWVRGYQLGGKSLTWGRHCYRLSDLDFNANAKEGIGVDWPIRYKDISPWYDYVESYVGISGEKLGLAHLPDGIFQPPMNLNIVEESLRKRIESRYKERNLMMGRLAVLTEPLNGRSPCHYCGPCMRGCSTASYFSSISTTIPDALATKHLTIRPDSIVHSIIYDSQTNRASGVRVIDTETKETYEYKANLIFLCASTLNSTQILLNSKSNDFPTGIGNSSGVLGKYLMDHHMMVGAYGEMPGFEDYYHQGNRPAGFYIPRYRNISDASRSSTFIRGYGAEGEAGRASWNRSVDESLIGTDLKNTLRKPGPWMVGWTCLGEMLPNIKNQISLDDQLTDHWGIPQLRIRCKIGDNELAMRKDMKESSVEMLESSGAKNVVGYDFHKEGEYGAELGLGIHEMGTARMGTNPKTSFLNGYNQSHDVPNLFVTDGSCMPSSPPTKPFSNLHGSDSQSCELCSKFIPTRKDIKWRGDSL